MSLLDAEQSARYIDSLVASVQALEADLAAARDRLRQVEAERDALEAGREGRRRMPMPKTGPSAALDQSDADHYHLATELRQARALIAALEAQIADGMKSLANGVLARAERAEARIAALEADAKLASTDEILRVWRETSKADARGREDV